jgi:hypothetical protein
LERGKNDSKYRAFHKVEILVPSVFFSAYLFLMVYAGEWDFWWTTFADAASYINEGLRSTIRQNFSSLIYS